MTTDFNYFILDKNEHLLNKLTKNNLNVSETLPNSSVSMESYLELFMGERRKDLASVLSLTIVYSILFSTGIIGNISTCIVIGKNSYMHTATNYYLFSLAISDMLILILGKSCHPHVIYINLIVIGPFHSLTLTPMYP